jgi:hypothetical protein
MDAAKKYLEPIGALEGLELGNEPMYWQCPRIGGWDQKGRFVPGWGGFAQYFHRVANNVSGCAAGAKGGAVTKLIGPAWDNLNTMPPAQIKQVLEAGKCYIQTVSIHYYPYYTKGAFDPKVLVSEDLMREAVRNVSLALRTIAPYGYKLRITEANSISGVWGGGLCDSSTSCQWWQQHAGGHSSYAVQTQQAQSPRRAAQNVNCCGWQDGPPATNPWMRTYIQG